MRVETEPDLTQIVGLTAFALALRDETYIHSFILRSLEHGYNTIRVGSETGGWSDNNVRWLPPGPRACTEEARKNLKRLLKVAAQYPNFWVEVVAGFTERDNHALTKQWSRQVANICAPYQNVLISAMNEPQMSNWTTRELNELIQILKKSGRYVGIDQPAEGGHWKFNRNLRVDFQAMHPKRNPRPTLSELHNISNLNGLVLLDETTCYVTDWQVQNYRLANNSLFYNNGNGKEKKRQKLAEVYMEDIRSIRDLRWFFHSIDLIMCEVLDFWLPKWR